jgi:D-sedoheptulose 7-phosphate isomerase
MSFPQKRYEDVGGYADAYFERLKAASASLSPSALQAAADLLLEVYERGGIVYTCGNGGSASLANQFVCDHSKLVQTDTDLTPRVYSLSSTAEIISAISNDLSFDEVFVYQLRSLAKPGDLLFTISSSGDSENVVRAARWAQENDMAVISLTGFSGGRSSEIADVNLHVDADNYGVIEDTHQSLMHILAQYIRQRRMEPEIIAERKF